MEGRRVSFSREKDRDDEWETRLTTQKTFLNEMKEKKVKSAAGLDFPGASNTNSKREGRRMRSSPPSRVSGESSNDRTQHGLLVENMQSIVEGSVRVERSE